MQIDPQATIEGVPLTVIRKMFRRDGLKGTLTAEFVRGTLHVSESGAAALLRASVTVGFLRRERAGLWHLTTAGIRLREATAAKPLIRRTAERLLEDLLQRMTALNEDPRFLARGEKAIVFDCYLDAGDLGKPRQALKRRTTQNRRSQHLICHVFGWGSGPIGSGVDETSSSRRALRIESNVCTCYSIYGVKHLNISNMLW